MNKLYRFVSLILVAVLFFQCQKDISYVGEPDNPNTPNIVLPDPITSNVQGNVLDESNQPAAGVTVKVGNKTAITDAKGYFKIAAASLDKNTSLVTAEKSGYFPGYRVFGATSGTNQIVIKLVKKNLAGTISASAGGDATLSNGTKVSLPANGIVLKSSGTAYTGDVRVFAAYIDPSASDIMNTVPGSFAATDKNGSRVTLTSYGMVAVELESPTGEKLQIKDGASATLTTPIPSAAQANAPTSIALWYVDEQTGIWKEEGTATRQGNNYVGQVNHFSFWNCDYPNAAVNVTVTVKNSADSLPLVHVLVKISRTGPGWQSSGYGYTDSLGQVSGLVPANEALVLQVLDPCYNAIFSQNIAAIPVSQQTANLGTVYVSASSTAITTFKGTLLNCTGSPVTNGFAIISYSNIVRYAATDANGEYEISFVTCSGGSATAQVIGVDEAGGAQSSVNNVTVASPVTSAGTITACGTSTAQFINYTLDGTNYSIGSAVSDSIVAVYVNQGATFRYVMIMANKMSNGDNISFQAENATSTGTFNMKNLGIQNYQNIILMSPSTVTFTSYANNVGEFYEGSFTTNFSAGTPTVVHTLSGNFRLRRMY